MTRRLAAVLLDLAIRRWPAGLRDELSREWSAELHMLAAGGQRTKMLGFASSLAASRPAADPLVDRSVMTKRGWGTAATVLLAPVACIAALVGGAILMNLSLQGVQQVFATSDFNSMDLQPLLITVFTSAAAVVIGLISWRLGRRSALTGPIKTVLVVMIPLPLPPLLIGLDTLMGQDTNAEELLAGIVVWVPGLTLVLLGAAWLTRSGRTGAAWAAGIAGAFMVFDLAVIARFLPPVDFLDYTYAPLWFPVSLFDSALGLSHPTPEDIFIVGDNVAGMPQMCVVFAAYGLAFVISALRPTAVSGKLPLPA